MRFELCKKKTKCSGCGTDMKADDIRGVVGSNTYNDPRRYLCLDCSKKDMFSPLDELIKIYKSKIKLYEDKIKKLNHLRTQI
jgi:hypothetical protein